MNQSNKDQQYRIYSTFSDFNKTLYYREIYNFLKRLNIEYPGFSKWYHGLFLENRELRYDR